MLSLKHFIYKFNINSTKEIEYVQHSPAQGTNLSTIGFW